MPVLIQSLPIPMPSSRVLLLMITLLLVSVSGQLSAADKSASQPNVLVWMMDDVGFAQVSAYGGLVKTPNIDRVAANGLTFSNYHTAPICSAARASFLTGRMPHSVHIGGHATAARDFPGYDGKIPASAGTLAENLRQQGYATLAVGKWDHLPSGDASPAGPFTYWPSGQGFDRFYGFLAADTDNWNPTLFEDHAPITVPPADHYHFSADMANRAITMIDALRGRDPASPFFMYWATGAAHAPHHAPKSWIEAYRGSFDSGWDVARNRILANQKRLGLMPESATLAPRPEGMPEWESLSADAKRLYAAQMEAFAASLSYADAQFGRVLDHLKAIGQLDNTLVVIVSDNGASAEGGPDGLYNEAEVTRADRPDVAANLRFLDKWGGPETYPHYSYGWAVAGDTPFRYYKQTTHEGGTRVPLLMSWPAGIAARGELRAQFVHVSDVAPTILDAVGADLAETVNNVTQRPMEGVSFTSAFTAAGDSRDGRAQYVELYGNRGLWQQGWSLVTSHRYKTWDWNTAPTFDEPWELYDLVTDPGQTRNVASDYPERVALMNDEFWRQVALYNVEPIHNLRDTAVDSYRRSAADFKRRSGRWAYTGPVANVAFALAPPVNNLGFRFSANIAPERNNVTGSIFALGGRMGGVGLQLVNGYLDLTLRTVPGDAVSVTTPIVLPAGDHAVALEMLKGDANSYTVTMHIDGQLAVKQQLEFVMPRYFGLAETFGVGIDSGSTVHPAVVPNRYIDAQVTNIVFDFATSGELKPTVHE